MKFGTGHIIDPSGELDRVENRHLVHLVGADAPLPDAIDLRSYDPGILNQGQSEACVWHAISDAIFMRGEVERQKGISDGFPFPSIMQAWVLAQWQAQADLGVPPEKRVASNVGSVASAGLRALASFGVASAERWPFDVSQLTPDAHGNVVLDMPLDVDVEASVAKLTGDYGVYSADAPALFRAALAQLFFPVVAFDVCQKFEELAGPDPEYSGPEDRPVLGRHMVLVVGCRPGFLLLKNSWGSGWGDNGYFWITDGYIASPPARDAAVVTAAPHRLA